MDDHYQKEYKRLIRIIVISWFLLVILVAGVIALFTYVIQDINRNVHEQDQIVKEKSIEIDQLKGFIKSITILQGNTGPAGPDGAIGIAGNAGGAGAAGSAGSTGSNGANGHDGKSTYELWLTLPGNQGRSLQDFIDSQKGKDGKNAIAPRETQFCYQSDGVTLGQHFVGTDFCNPIEAVQ